MENNQSTFLNLVEQLPEAKKTLIQSEYQLLDLKAIHKLYEEVYVNRDVALPMGEIKDIHTQDKTVMETSEIQKLEQKGLEAIQSGKFAAVLMAGGQGTRLEHPGPKGTFDFDGITLFELQARQIIALNQQLDVEIPWIIMTSDINHEETLACFEANNYFNVPREKVTFFKQPNIVSLSESGDLLINNDYSILKAPNGNGGIFEAMADEAIYTMLHAIGVEYIYLNNIDNVLVKVLDPVLCGLAVESQADVTTKTIRAKDDESVGRVVEVDGKKQVIEYTELPTGHENTYRNANIGIHIFKLSFLMDAAKKEMPYHLAIKNLEQLDASLNVVKQPTLKFEKFYFDIFKYANTFATLQVDRASEFSPLKNKVGKDSIETARQSLIDNNIIKG